VAQFAAWGDIGVRAIELQGKDASSPQNGGGHPWDIRGGTTSTLFLFSHGANGVKKIDVQISSGSEFWWKSYKLAPMETKAININDIMAQGIPDDKGHRISKTAVQGQIAWFAGFPKWGKGRLMLSRPVEGLARSFSCGICTTDCNHGTMSPHSSITVAVGGSDYLGDIQLQNCSINCNQLGCGSTVIGPTYPSSTTWSPPGWNGILHRVGRSLRIHGYRHKPWYRIGDLELPRRRGPSEIVLVGGKWIDNGQAVDNEYFAIQRPDRNNG
jgi:hypothetical protein